VLLMMQGKKQWTAARWPPCSQTRPSLPQQYQDAAAWRRRPAERADHKATPVMCSSCGDQSHSQVDLTLPDLVAVCWGRAAACRDQKSNLIRGRPSQQLKAALLQPENTPESTFNSLLSCRSSCWSPGCCCWQICPLCSSALTSNGRGRQPGRGGGQPAQGEHDAQCRHVSGGPARADRGLLVLRTSSGQAQHTAAQTARRCAWAQARCRPLTRCAGTTHNL
jgi:hypothetical protein